MTRDQVITRCPTLDNVEITTKRGTWRVRLLDDDEELPGATDANITIGYTGPETGRLRLHLDREHVTDDYVKLVFHDLFGLDPLPKG